MSLTLNWGPTGLLGWDFSLNHCTMMWFAPQKVHRILDIFQKLGQWQQQNMVRIQPNTHPLHMEVVKHLLCLTLKWGHTWMGTMLWFAPLEVPRILDNFQKLGQWQQQYVNMIHPYAHPQHMKAVKHLICVWHWCGGPLGWVYILCICVTHWFAPLEVPRFLGYFQKLGLWEQWYYGKDSPICTCHSIWSLYDNLYTFDVK